ncbi:MAG: insulinase family protein, partial [Cyclobacteriaceae bacterium]|nr:insulinase family protein [Cyclobacteriaceae bacterium]
IGTLNNLENFDYEALERFYKDWYRPDLMAVIAIGDFDVSDIELRIKEHFSGIKIPTDRRERKEFVIPDHEETLVSIASDKEATFSTVSLYIKNDFEVKTTLQGYYEGLLNTFYTNILNQRLQEIAQQPAPPFIGAGTGYGKFLGDKAAFTAGANVKEGEILEGIRSVLTEIERVKRYGFTEPELERFKKDYLSYFEKVYNERDKSQSSSYAAEYIRNFLESESIPGIEFEYAFAQKYIPQISLEEINALSNKYFRPDNRVVIVNAPKKDDYILPTEEEILSVVNETSQKHVSPYIDNIAGAVLMQELPKPGSIKSEKKLEAINTTEIILSNGAKVILKPTDFKNDEVLMTAWSDGGNSLYPDEDYQSAANADAVVNECGVGNFSPTDLQKILAGKAANARPFIGTLSEGMNGSCVPKDMESMFQLLYLYFTSPNKSEDLFQSYKDKNKALYKNLLSNPTYYFYNESAKIMTQNHPRGGQFPTEEDWDKIDFDRTFEIYKERFGNAADFTFIFVGNFRIDSIKPYLSQYIASLPSSDERESWKDLGIRRPSGAVKKDIKKGSDPKSSVSIRFHGTYKFDRKTNHLISTLTDVMDIVLTEKIREEQGG